ncbi:MAG: SpoIID/LytB domain-containing protein, partial [Elusimicrobiota bacterium]
MGSIPIARSIFSGIVTKPASVALLLFAGSWAASAAPQDLARARALYFSGDVLKSAESFEAAVKISSSDAEAWLDGAIAWADAGRPEKAVAWNQKASALSSGAEARAALGWSLLRTGRAAEADAEFTLALAREPGLSQAILGAGRAKLSLGKAAEAVPLFTRAASWSSQKILADFYLGRAHEALGDTAAVTQDYSRAVNADAYFHEGRDPLTRAYLRQRRYNDAWRQLSRLADAEPSTRLTRALLETIRPLLSVSAEPRPAVKRGPIAAPDAVSETSERGISLIRVGIATTTMGRPRPRVWLTIRGSGAWKALDPKSKRVLASPAPQESWTVRIVPAKKKGKNRLELRGPDGERRVVPGDSVLLKPDAPAQSALSLEDDPGRGGPLAAGRALRGVIEVTLWSRRRSLRLVNIVDLEDYTHGVIGAEMPAGSPLEALKTQAIIARTHALFIKTVTKRHKSEGYDICDEQHCQVYAGLRAETERTRSVVTATRGQVARYQGRLAHVIYSANCGGSTQSGSDIGWGAVPYWTRVCDAPLPDAPPGSPLELRRRLINWPAGFCKPSGYVHASHSRWVRVIPAKELGEKLNRRFKMGRLKGLRVLRRAPSGHVSALLVLGSKRNVKLKDEMAIRSLLGVGSLRSTLFVVDTEYRREKAVLVPDAFIFHGGGWGHSVGLCQS